MPLTISFYEKAPCPVCNQTGEVDGLLGKIKCYNCDGKKVVNIEKEYTVPNSTTEENCKSCIYHKMFNPPHNTMVACCRYPPQLKTYGTSLIMSGLTSEEVVAVDKSYKCGEYKHE
jgi:hypothetical protein